MPAIPARVCSNFSLPEMVTDGLTRGDAMGAALLLAGSLFDGSGRGFWPTGGGLRVSTGLGPKGPLWEHSSL